MLKIGWKEIYSFEEQIKNQIKEEIIIFIPAILDILKKLFFKYYYTLYCFESRNSNENINKLNFQKLFDSELETIRQLLEYYLEHCFDSKWVANETPEFNEKIIQLDELMSKYNELVFFGRKNPYFGNTTILPIWPYDFLKIEQETKDFLLLLAQAQELFNNAKQILESAQFDISKAAKILENTKAQLIDNLSAQSLENFDSKELRQQAFFLTPDLFPSRMKRYYEANKDKIVSLEWLK